ncbi:PREDICTED: uncharacterized protein LOC104716891 isoform X2 [Camelina sativa]|uniref:Uncharacterized protein LOC104716891 isoform X2 n=1 Tax=Camelina sativa TaxID=90675 RepID=A0ABM0TWZ3_CAMSA|nr:PREDICTED: uncharacterized protein LOC104716891 isoform X2 [Camelina sativa]
MGGKEGAIGRCCIKFANKFYQHVDCKMFSCAVTFVAGASYGDITGGVVKDWDTKEKLELERKDLERQIQEYEAEARKVMGSSEAANAV